MRRHRSIPLLLAGLLLLGDLGPAVRAQARQPVREMTVVAELLPTGDVVLHWEVQAGPVGKFDAERIASRGGSSSSRKRTTSATRRTSAFVPDRKTSTATSAKTSTSRASSSKATAEAKAKAEAEAKAKAEAQAAARAKAEAEAKAAQEAQALAEQRARQRAEAKAEAKAKAEAEAKAKAEAQAAAAAKAEAEAKAAQEAQALAEQRARQRAEEEAKAKAKAKAEAEAKAKAEAQAAAAAKAEAEAKAAQEAQALAEQRARQRAEEEAKAKAKAKAEAEAKAKAEAQAAAAAKAEAEAKAAREAQALAEQRARQRAEEEAEAKAKAEAEAETKPAAESKAAEEAKAAREAQAPAEQRARQFVEEAATAEAGSKPSADDAEKAGTEPADRERNTALVGTRIEQAGRQTAEAASGDALQADRVSRSDIDTGVELETDASTGRDRRDDAAETAERVDRIPGESRLPGDARMDASRVVMERIVNLPRSRAQLSESFVRRELEGEGWVSAWVSELPQAERPTSMRARILRARDGGSFAEIPAQAVPRPLLTRTGLGRFWAGAYTDRDAQRGSVYRYRVELLDGDGKRIAQSPEIEVEVHDGAPPGEVPDVTVTPREETIAVSWSRLDDPEVRGYRIYRSIVGQEPGADAGSISRMRTIRGRGEAPATAAQADRRPDVPDGLVAEQASASDRRDGSGGSPPLQVERVERLPLEAWTRFEAAPLMISALRNPMLFREPHAVTGPDLTAFVDYDVQPKTAYDYRVVAFDAHSGDGPLGVPHVATLPDREPPTPARNPTAAARDGGEVDVSWSASRASDVTSYRVFRKTDGGTPIPIRVVEAGTREVVDRLDPYSDATFSYAIVALDAAGNAAGPAESPGVRLPDIRPPAPPTIVRIEPGDGTVTLGWTAPGDPDVAQFRLYRTRGAEAETRLATLPGGLEYTDDSGLLGATYTYRVTAVDAEGNESEPSHAYAQRVVGTVDPVPPTGLNASRDARGGFTLKWNAIEGVADTGYVVLRGEGAAGPFRPVSGLVRGTTFRDAPPPGIGAAYRVIARYFDGQVSAPSAVVTASGDSTRTLGGR